MKLQFHCYHNFLFFDLTFNEKLSLRGLPISLFILEIFAKSVRDIMLSKLTGKLRSFAYYVCASLTISSPSSVVQKHF